MFINFQFPLTCQYFLIVSVSVDDIQAACYKILDSAYLLNGLGSEPPQVHHRKSIAYETEK